MYPCRWQVRKVGKIFVSLSYWPNIFKAQFFFVSCQFHSFNVPVNPLCYTVSLCKEIVPPA